MKLDMKYIGKLAATLCATCAVVAGLLGLVNSVTAGPIEQINIENTNKALAAVFQGAAAPEFPHCFTANKNTIFFSLKDCQKGFFNYNTISSGKYEYEI